MRAYRHIDEIDPAEWDAPLDPDDLQATHRFVRSCQHADIEGARYRHVLLRDPEGVVGVATLSAFQVSLDALSSRATRAVVAGGRYLWPGLLRVPIVFCGLPVSFGRSCLQLSPRADRSACLRLLTDEAESFARECDAQVLCFKEFTEGEAAALSPLERLGYFRARSLPSCLLELRWRTFADYEASLRSGYRRQVKSTLAVREAEGLRVRFAPSVEPEVPRIFGLYRQVMDHAAFRLETLPRSFFEQLARNLSGELSLVLLERGDALVAWALLLRGPTQTAFLLTGIDYTQPRATQAYPNLVLEVVRAAIESGSRRLEMGQTSYLLKGRLGASPTDRALFLRHRSQWGQTLLRTTRGLLFPETRLHRRRVFRDSAVPPVRAENRALGRV